MIFSNFFARMDFMSDTELDKKNGAVWETNPKIYELGYLLVPTITEADVPAAFGNLKELVTSLGGISISEEMPKPMSLAYLMSKVIANVRHKFNSAYFGWLKFTMDAERIPELKRKLDPDANLLRFLILKTVKENTIAAKRFIRPEPQKRPKTQKTGDLEPALPINKEEIDKEIDAMVAI